MSFAYTAPMLAASLDATPVVCVVDGDAALRETLASLVLSAGWQVSTAESAEEFLVRPRVMVPGCLLVEIDLPGASGLELQRLVGERTELPVIFMSSHIDVPATVQAMKAGAFEFLTKPLVHGVLLEAVAGAIERSHAALRETSQRHSLEQRYESLSRREREVLQLLVRGRLNKQVGTTLGISEITVKAHRGKMMRKMQAGSLAELVMMAARLRPASDCGLDDVHGECVDSARVWHPAGSYGSALLTAP